MTDAPQSRRWKYAKTYGDATHEYILANWEQDLYRYYREKIKQEGVRERFTLRGQTRTYKYYHDHAGGYRYWIIGPVLNRARF